MKDVPVVTQRKAAMDNQVDENSTDSDSSNDSDSDSSSSGEDVNAQSRQWCKLETLSIDPSIGQRYHSNARFHWPNLVDQHQKTNADYFMLFYPMRGLSNMLMCTNLNMARKNLPPLGKGEFIKYLGLQLAMTCEPKRGPIPVYWQVGDEPGSVYTGADFGGRFGMTRHRFQDITNCFSFTVPRDGVGADDNIIPGCHLTVDECMSAWKGSDGEYVAEGMPHKTKIARKPEGVGAEMKALACEETGIILKLDMMEGGEANRRKDFSQEYGEGTAVTLRLTKEYYGTGRVVHADSAFSSMKTLLALRERGLFFMGMIKTAHKEYPLAFLKSWANGDEEGGKPSRGNYCLLQTQSQHGLPFYALGWADRKVKTIISNVGSTNPGSINSYLAYKFDMEAVHNSPDDLITYLGKLAYQLIHNNFLGQGMAMRNEDNGNPSGQV
eukprot:Em0007g279a